MKLDDLASMRIETRVNLSGKIYSKDQLQRSKRYAFSREHSHLSSSYGTSLIYVLGMC